MGFAGQLFDKKGEGSFITQPILLFNSRRIGREPQAIDPGEGQIIQQPSQTQIIGAAKIFGKTQNNTSFGFLTSITANEYATIEIESDNGQITKKELNLQHFNIVYTGNIGKAYRRHDEVGTPICITVDFDSIDKKTITIRDRDTMEQKTMPIEALKGVFTETIKK